MIRRLIPILCCILVFGLLLSACSDSEKREDGRKYPVYSDDGVLTGYEREFHNTEGLLSRLDVFDADDNYDHYVIYEYDSDQRLIKESTYGADGIGKFYYEYEYDDNGEKSKESYVTMSDGYTITLFENGVISEIYRYDAKDNLISHEVFSKSTSNET